MRNISDLTKPEAGKIITSLRSGTPPNEGVEFFSVGRNGLMDHFDEKLDQIRDWEMFDIKFINADYGQGKSHFLDLVQDLAFEKGFVVSKLELHSKEAPFNKLILVIQRIMAKISTPENRNGGLDYLLDRWCDKNEGKADKELLDGLSFKGRKVYPQMRSKLLDYYKHHRAGEYQRCLEDLKWFQGRETPSKTFTNEREFLHHFVLFVRSLGYSGLVVMLDEAEAISSLSNIKKVDEANENIRQFIDNEMDTPCFYFLFASTPSFLSGQSDMLNASSYEALWRRIREPIDQLESDTERVILDLPDLSVDEFFEVAVKIKEIYGVMSGEQSSRIDEGNLRTLAEYVKKGADRRVSTLVRSTVAVLDATKQESFDFDSMFEKIAEQVRYKASVDWAS